MASSNLKSISRQNMLPPLFQFGEGTFKDTGCFDGEFPSCLRCPLLFCKYDTVQVKSESAYVRYKNRYPDAMRLVEMGLTAREVSRRTNVSASQARRLRDALKSHRGG